MDTLFTPITTADIPRLNAAFQKKASRLCNDSAGAAVLWQSYFQDAAAEIDGALVLREILPGVGTVDKDKCYKDYPTIIKEGGWNNWQPSEPVLDTNGFEKGDRTYGVMALKEMLLTAKKQGIITQGVDENNIFGDGTEIAVNQVLKKGGYAQNGIAGYGFMKYLGGLMRKKL